MRTLRSRIQPPSSAMAVALLALLGAVVPLALAGAQPALAAPGDPVVTTFAFTGAPQTFVVPAGVSSVEVTALGAGGGTGHGDTLGGRGGLTVARVPVTAGETLTVFVGGRGGDDGPPAPIPGGFNGGGPSASGSNGVEGGGGGGASDVRTGAASLSDRIVVAGGGGGGGADVLALFPCNSLGAQGGPGGVGGGLSGAPGSSGTSGSVGGGGTQTAGGAPGAEGGAAGAGGTGDSIGASPSGGGGGGGYFGGAGGLGSASCSESSPGGGGGSGYVDPSGIGVTLAGEGATGNGDVTIRYAEPSPPAAASASPAELAFPATPALSTSAPLTVTVTNTGGSPFTVGGQDFDGPDAADFFIGSQTCQSPLGPGDNCQVGVRFSPREGDGARTATLHIRTSAPGSPVVVALRGTAVARATGPAGPAGAGGTPGPSVEPPPTAALVSRRVRLSRAGTFALQLRCPGAVIACNGTAKVRTRTRLGARRVTLGIRSFQAPAGEPRRITFAVSRKVAARLRRAGAVSANVFVVVRSTGGSAHVQKLRFKLTASRLDGEARRACIGGGGGGAAKRGRAARPCRGAGAATGRGGRQ